jgi:hypothetical protein
LDQYETQIHERMMKGVCELSKIPLDLTSGKRTAFTPSLDRIEAGGPYTIDNVRVVCWGVNALLGDWGEQTALTLCSALLTKRDRQTASERFQESLTERLKAQLDQAGSMIYSLSWKDKVTPAGRPYCQRAASVPRTNAIDFSLVPISNWPTPTTNRFPQPDTERGLQSLAGQAQHLASWPTVTTIDNNQVQGEAAAANHPARGTTLDGMSRLAAWPTPTTRDHKDGQECQNVELNSLLGRVVWLTNWPSPTANSNDRTPNPDNAMNMYRADGSKVQQRLQDFAAITQPIRITASGQMLTGSDAGMGSSGQLNPAHSRWLMGFPPEWDDCAVMAMPLCRKLQPNSSALSWVPLKMRLKASK